MSRLALFAASLAFLAFSPIVFVSPAEAQRIERVVSPGGIEAWLVQENEVPVIVMNVAWEGGSASDPADKGGLANMVSGLLDEGAGDLDSRAFQTRLEETATRLSFSEDRDYFQGKLKMLAGKREEAFALFGLAITKPRFDAEAVERIRAQIGAIVARNMQDPEWLAAQAWYKAAFGDHPYARPGDGTPESIKRITRDDLHGFTKRVLARDNMKIAVVGPVTPEELGILLDKTFGALPPRAVLPAVPDVKLSGKPETVIVRRDFPQSVVLFGAQGLKRADPDFIPAYVMNYVLGGGGFSSRLTNEVREKRGLAYSVGSYLYPMRHAAIMMGEFGTKNATVGLSLSIVRAELKRMAGQGVTGKELADAKTYLTGSYPLRFDSNSSIANELIGIQVENLGIDYVDRRNGLIEAVSREDVARAARRLLHAGNLVVAVTGDPDMSAAPPPGVLAPHAMPDESGEPDEAPPGGMR